MISKLVIVAAMIALVEARFGQEQIPIQAIAQVQGGPPGLAQTIAGGAISDLLAAASPCNKLATADRIVAELGGGADALAAAIGLVAAEQNFNPSAIDRPTFCNDPTLPTTPELRGITPLVDPAVDGANLANQVSAQSRENPFNANGLSVAQVIAAQGFTTFNTKNAAGADGPTGDELAGGAAPPAEDIPDENEEEDAVEEPAACPAPVTVTVTATVVAPEATETPVATTTAAEPPAVTEAPEEEADANPDVQKSTIPGLDFGKCVPTMKFVGGLGGRPATEFTFQAIDPLVALGQQEALNPAIIVNRICDQLTNVCEANQAAKDACRAAQANIDSTQRNANTAIAFNTALGFASADVTRRSEDVYRRRAIEGVKRRSARVY